MTVKKSTYATAPSYYYTSRQDPHISTPRLRRAESIRIRPGHSNHIRPAMFNNVVAVNHAISAIREPFIAHIRLRRLPIAVFAPDQPFSGIRDAVVHRDLLVAPSPLAPPRALQEHVAGEGVVAADGGAEGDGYGADAVVGEGEGVVDAWLNLEIRRVVSLFTCLFAPCRGE